NGDTRQDLAVVDNANRLVSVLIGKGDGTFQTHVDYAVGTDPRSVAVADVNRDGIPDLIVTNYADSTVSVLLGSQAAPGTFTAASPFATGANPTNLAAGDFNGDGNVDLAVANSVGGVSILLGNGTGGFPTHVEYAAGNGSSG